MALLKKISYKESLQKPLIIKFTVWQLALNSNKNFHSSRDTIKLSKIQADLHSVYKDNSHKSLQKADSTIEK